MHGEAFNAWLMTSWYLACIFSVKQCPLPLSDLS